jgi:hypothetical protein
MPFFCKQRSNTEGRWEQGDDKFLGFTTNWSATTKMRILNVTLRSVESSQANLVDVGTRMLHSVHNFGGGGGHHEWIGFDGGGGFRNSS